MRRSKKFDFQLSKDLYDPEYAKGYFETLMEGDEGLSVEVALTVTIQTMGTTEFADLVGIPKSRVSEFMSDSSGTKLSTLDRMLKPFGFKTVITAKKAS
ncbi:MAG: hypothetical protein KA715_11085 [Xanthomonadaceae bacterium]|nr:hypothetical protein [Xanthomonadaceae bacterium]